MATPLLRTTYNAYLVIGEELALIDTTCRGFGGQMLDHVASILDPEEEAEYVIAYDVEMDSFRRSP